MPPPVPPGQPAGTLSRAAATLSLAALVAGLTACSGGSSGSGGTVTVTVAPTVTASVQPTDTPSIPPSSPTPPVSQVKGRTFDFGAIISVARSGTVDALKFDRWTVTGVDDAKLAKEGLVLRPHSDRPYTNQNPVTYVVPVRDDAAFTYRHCTSTEQPVTAKTVTLAQMAALKGDERLVLLSLDADGWVLRGENDPACPAPPPSS